LVLSLVTATQLDAYQLLSYALFSLARMSIAMAISIVFALTVGMLAARRRRVGKVLLLILDILQSVPILGFFPAAIFFFVLLYGDVLGVEMAAVFLIFTGMAWNMAFSVYESMTTIPADLVEVGEVFGVSGWRRVTVLYLPAVAPKLVYNILMSWAGGWYFLTAAEIISFGASSYALPGLGRYIAQSASSYDWMGLSAGLGVLVGIILLMEYLLWHPLETYAERFKYETVGAQKAGRMTGPMIVGYRLTHSHVTKRLRVRLLRRTAILSDFLSSLSGWVGRLVTSAILRSPRLRKAIYLAALACFIVVLYDVMPDFIEGISYVMGDAAKLASSPSMTKELYELPLHVGASLSRLAVAYAISVAWTLPAAYLIGRSDRATSLVLPLFEVIASIPGISYFPLVLVLLLGFAWGPNVASIILVLTGMQWYLLFNLVGGMRTVPAELSEASNLFGVKGMRLWKVLILPALAPTFITGSITAWGGGWNALIVSEYIAFTDRTIRLPGLGGLLDAATFQYGNVALLLMALLTMSAVILCFNTLIWRRLYGITSERYRLEVGQ